MARRRGNGEGSIYQRASDQRWTAVLSLPDGKRRALYGKTRTEVQRKLRQAIRDQEEGGAVLDPERQTVGQYLDTWLAGTLKLRASTKERYADHLVHLRSHLGRYPLKSLTPEPIQAMVASITTAISPSRARHVYATLRSALNDAVRARRLPRNPAQYVELPEVVRSERPAISAEHGQRILEAVRGDKWEAAYVVLITAGLRINELLGLTWDAVDLERGLIDVRQQVFRPDGGGWRLVPLKSRSGRRTVPIPPLTTLALRRHRAEQQEQRRLSDTAWVEYGLIFTTMFGTPQTCSNVRTRFAWLLKRAGLPHVRPHDLRHGAASIWFAQGIQAKTISTLLGHATVGITMDLYTHVEARLSRDAADQMQQALAPDSAPTATPAAVNAANEEVQHA